MIVIVMNWEVFCEAVANGDGLKKGQTQKFFIFQHTHTHTHTTLRRKFCCARPNVKDKKKEAKLFGGLLAAAAAASRNKTPPTLSSSSSS